MKLKDKKSVIEKEAAKLFEKSGYIETSLKDISIAAKLSKGGIYHYFSNKHEILFSIINKYLDLLAKGLDDDLKGIKDPSERIKFILYRHLQMYSENAPEAKATLLYSRSLPLKYFKIIAKKQKNYARHLTNILIEMYEGRMSEAIAKALSYNLFGMCNSIMYWYKPDGKVSLEELKELIYQIFMNGINGYKKLLVEGEKEKTSLLMVKHKNAQQHIGIVK